MKRKVPIEMYYLIIFIILIFGFQYYKAESNSKKYYFVQYNGIRCEHNNSVGNEWMHSFKINNIEFKNGEKKKFGLNEELNIDVKSIEADKYPDVGINSVRYTKDDMNQLNESSFEIKKELEVNIYESNGRYKGNSAKWIYSYSITNKLSFMDKLKMMFSKD